MAWALEDRLELLEQALATRPTFVSFSFGPPGPYISELHDAGGHTGSVGTLPLLQLVLDAVDIPVVAAGGIAPGRGPAAVLAAGGRCLGGHLAARPPGGDHHARRSGQGVRRRRERHGLTRVFDVAQGIGWPEGFAGRAPRDRFTDAWHGREAELTADLAARHRLADARKAGAYDTAYVCAGQAVALVRQSLPAAQVVQSFGEGTASLLAERSEGLFGNERRSR